MNLFFKVILSVMMLSIVVEAKEKRKPSSIGLSSSQEIVFYAKKERMFSTMGQISEFQGRLVQLNESSSSLSESDLYLFSKESKSVMTAELCNRYADKIFGTEQARSLKMKDSLKLFQTSVGKSCEYNLTDTYEHANLRYRYVITGFIHGRLIALVWSLDNAPTASQTEKLRSFWKSLK